MTFYTSLTWAQIDIGKAGNQIAENAHNENIKKYEAAKNVAIYNGALIGYSNNCNISEEKKAIVITKMFNNFSAVSLTQAETSQLTEVYTQALNKAKNKQLNPQDCNNINQVMDNIYKSNLERK